MVGGESGGESVGTDMTVETLVKPAEAFGGRLLSKARGVVEDTVAAARFSCWRSKRVLGFSMGTTSVRGATPRSRGLMRLALSQAWKLLRALLGGSDGVGDYFIGKIKGLAGGAVLFDSLTEATHLVIDGGAGLFGAESDTGVSGELKAVEGADFGCLATNCIKAEEPEDFGFLEIEFGTLGIPEAGLEDEVGGGVADIAGGLAGPGETAVRHFAAGFEGGGIFTEGGRDEDAGTVAGVRLFQLADNGIVFGGSSELDGDILGLVGGGIKGEDEVREFGDATGAIMATVEAFAAIGFEVEPGGEIAGFDTGGTVFIGTFGPYFPADRPGVDMDIGGDGDIPWVGDRGFEAEANPGAVGSRGGEGEEGEESEEGEEGCEVFHG